MSRPDDLRVGDAERTRVTEALHDHFAQGRLTREELDERLDATLAAKTYGDLRRVTQDLPTESPATAAGPSAAPWSGHTPPVGWRRPRFPFLGVLAVIFIVAALTGGPGWALFGVLKVILVAWLVLAVVGMLHVRRWHRYARRRGGWHGYGGPGQWHPGMYGPRRRQRR